MYKPKKTIFPKVVELPKYPTLKKQNFSADKSCEFKTPPRKYMMAYDLMVDMALDRVIEWKGRTGFLWLISSSWNKAFFS